MNEKVYIMNRDQMVLYDEGFFFGLFIDSQKLFRMVDMESKSVDTICSEIHLQVLRWRKWERTSRDSKYLHQILNMVRMK